MIEISPELTIDENELHFTYIRASGPGGQNVNKVATSVQMRFDVITSLSLPEDVKERLIKLGGSKMTEDGILIIEAKRYRTQEQNRSDAIQRLTTLINKAEETRKARIATRPRASAKAERLTTKKKHGQLKRDRQTSPKEWD